MRCPTLKDLPPPPPGKTGWPWTEESPRLANLMTDGTPWPRISIVTPSYNQGQFIEETIRSVLLQGYPDIEYIIIDGGSTDESVEVIRRYEQWITYWVSEKDKGQAHAINKGFTRSTGNVVAWLNSDDIYFPEIIQYVADQYRMNTEKNFWLVAGIEYFDHETGERVVDYQKPWYSVTDWVLGNANPNQQGSFWGRPIINNAGLLLENMHFGFDKEYFTRLIALGYRFSCPADIIAGRYRQHKDCKWKKGLMPFQYEWLQISLLHLPSNLMNYHDLRRDVCHKMAYFEIRFSQDKTLKNAKRLAWLLKALFHSPKILVRDRAFIGSLLRIIFPGYRKH